jgi:ferredoxin
MLKKIRVISAVFFMSALSLLFLDYTGTLHAYLGWTAKLQFIPAVLSHNFALIAALIVLSLLFGRIYCSAICPLGIFQDIFSHRLKRNNYFGFRPSKKPLVILRFSILGVFVIAIIAKISIIVSLIEPYSAFGRMISQIFGPVYKFGNNILAHFAERAGSYAFYSVDIWLKSAGSLVVAALTFIVIVAFALKSGRGYCNTICPVGALLGLLAKYSFIKPRIEKSKCGSCGLCAKNCKASCIDPKNKKFDYLRCVSCFNCKKSCPKDAIIYLPKSDTSSSKTQGGKLTNDGSSRRNFVSAMSILALGFFTKSFSRGYRFDGGLAPLEDKKAPKRATPLIPAGAESIRNFSRHCTACHLCVTTCPNQVLRPSKNLQPQMSFERGYCRPECVKCSQVCPTNAINPITAAEKSAIQIGYAVWQQDLCVNITDGVNCDLCSHKCPTSAITLINQIAEDSSSPKIPMIDTNRCIGCGACENLCPSRPHSAIYVEGINTHRTI